MIKLVLNLYLLKETLSVVCFVSENLLVIVVTYFACCQRSRSGGDFLVGLLLLVSSQIQSTCQDGGDNTISVSLLIGISLVLLLLSMAFIQNTRNYKMFRDLREIRKILKIILRIRLKILCYVSKG